MDGYGGHLPRCLGLVRRAVAVVDVLPLRQPGLGVRRWGGERGVLPVAERTAGVGAFFRFGVDGAVLLVQPPAVEACLWVALSTGLGFRSETPGGAGFVEDRFGDLGFRAGEGAVPV